MRRFAVAAAALALLATPAFGATKPVKARVSPHGGGPETVFRVGFSAPKTTDYTISLALHGNGGACATSATRYVPKARAGERVHRRFVPDAPWCRGRWTGTVVKEDTPACFKSDPPCEMPSMMGVVIGRFHFRVR